MSREKPIYCGKAMERQGQYGTFFSLNISLDDIPPELVVNARNGKRYVNLTMSLLRYPDDFGNTHTIRVDTHRAQDDRKGKDRGNYQGRSQRAPKPAPAAPVQQAGPESFEDDQIPF